MAVAYKSAELAVDADGKIMGTKDHAAVHGDL
jgi:hypothetical protein